MKKLRQIISAALTAILILPAAPFSARAESGSEPARVSYIVETDGTALLMRSAAATLGAEEYLDSRSGQAAADALVSMQDEIVSEIKDTVDPSAEVGYTYTTVFSGFSIEIAEGTEEDILALPGVKNIYPVYEYKFVNPDVVVDPKDYPDTLDNCCEMMGIDEMHENGYDGKEQVVAVIDTELDVSHPMFTEAPQDPKYSEDDINTVITNNNMSRSLTADEVYRSAKIPFAYSYGKGKADVSSNDPDVIHGTHVSGIAVGKNGKLPDGSSFSGAAPEAQLIFFGVTNANGIMRNDVIIAALNDAVLFGVSAVNISLGSDYVFKDNAFINALDTAETAGVTVSISSGNAARGNALSDDTRVFAEHPDSGAIDSPSSVSSSFSVASADNTYAWMLANKAVLSNDIEIPFKDVYRFVDTFKNSGAIEYVHCGTGTSEDFSGKDLDGKLALIDRGGISFEEKAANAEKAGAVGVIFASLDGDISWAPSYTTDIPSALVSRSTREKLVAAEKKSLTVTDETMTSQSSYPNAVSSYSSWGPNASLELKPDITAPGGNIYSAYPGGYAVMSGTSMAAPHITGAAALITQYMDENNIVKTGSARTAFIKNLLASGADIITDETYGLPYSPRAQGAGLADVYDAINIPVILKGEDGTTKVSLYDDRADDFTVSFTAENLTNKPVTYDKIDITVQTDGTVPDTDGAVIVSGEQPIEHEAQLPNNVTITANGTENISIKVTLDSAAVSGLESVFTNGFYVEGFVTLSDSTGKSEQVNIPYMGFHGDWTDAPAFDAPYYSEDSVYGRTYLASGTACANDLNKDYCAVLGTNPLVKLKGAALSGDASGYEGEQYAGISPNGDGCYDYLCTVISPLRTLDNVNIGIYAAGGGIQLTQTGDGYIDKYYQDHFDFKCEDLANLPEGDYTVKASGSLPYGDAETETIEMDFYIDKSAPALTKAELSGTTLTLAASDERYIAGFVVSDGNDEKVIAVTPAPERETTVDVSDMSTENLTVTVYDYAANTRKISLDESKTHAQVNNTEAYIEPVYIKAETFNGRTSDGSTVEADVASLADGITITAGNCAVTGINVFLKDDNETDRIVGRTASETAPGTATCETDTEQTITIAEGSSVTIAVILDGIAADEIGIQVIE